MKPNVEILKENIHKLVVQTRTEGDCLIWTGYTDEDGYGIFQFRYEGVKYKIRAHIAVYLIAGGVLEVDEILRHNCDRRACLRFDHLIPGTHVDNVMDRVVRQRSATGSRNGRAKLSKAVVVHIRTELRNGQTRPDLAKKYGVDRSAIRAIETGRTWR
jgi:hypothetical protein